MVILRRWSVAFPALAIVAMALTWGSHPGTPVLVVAGLLLAGAVLAAVHHAEVVAHRVGEPFGSLVLAVVGLAKVESDPIEDAVESIGAPQSAVGVLIALLVLLPETLARSATRSVTACRRASTSPTARPSRASASRSRRSRSPRSGSTGRSCSAWGRSCCWVSP
jgi:Ca2+/H+ antiporter